MTAQVDYQGASAEAIQHHYDVGNEFYDLWLDEDRVYSCALWDGPQDSLRDAQHRKIDHLISGAQLAGKDRVLDVGCGWGSVLERLVEQHGVGSATGLTLSEAQAEHIREHADPRYDVHVQNWADHRPEQPYDGIISIGAFEHFADFGLNRAGKVDAYREFFTRAGEWLPSGGRLALQTIVKGSNTVLDRKTVRDLLFVADKIFPGSEVPWPSEVLEAAERIFNVVSARNDPDHYARTCLEWRDRMLARREEAEQLVGPQLVADYDRYLRGMADGFTNRHLGLARIVFERV